MVCVQRIILGLVCGAQSEALTMLLRHLRDYDVPEPGMQSDIYICWVALT